MKISIVIPTIEEEAVKEMKKAEEGKILVDVSNPMDKNWRWAKGFNESAAEELAKHAKGAKVVALVVEGDADMALGNRLP